MHEKCTLVWYNVSYHTIHAKQERVHTIMIYQENISEKNNLEISKAIIALKIPKFLRDANIRKKDGYTALTVFKHLILLVFEGKNLFRLLDCKMALDRPAKDTYYRFLNESTFAWRRFLISLSTQVISGFGRLTSKSRVKVFIIDDSLYSRAKSKKVELLSWVHDHTTGKMVKGFSMLTLGWSDGYSFIPVDFDMLSSANDSNRLTEINTQVDKRSHGYKRRKGALLKRPESVDKMIARALDAGICADYVLMDSWFTNEPMIKNMLSHGLNVIGMLKDMKQKYEFNGAWLSLKELRARLKSSDFTDLIGEITVKTKSGIPVKLVFIKNRNKRKEWLALLSTDLDITADEIIRIYGMRWDIEVFFKATKSLFKLAKEFQGRSYDMIVCHTTIVFTRFIILQWIHREHNDYRTIGGLFFDYCDEVQQVDFVDALKSLIDIFEELKSNVSKKVKNMISCLLDKWIQSQPSHIKLLLGLLVCES